MKTAQRAIAASLFTGLLVLAAGCGGDKKSHLSGVVTYNNLPVTGGNITLASDAGGTYSCPIQMDGNYLITDILSGTYSVTVETETVNPDRKTPAYGGQKMGPGAGTASKMEKMNKDYENQMKKGGETGSLAAGGNSFGPASREELLKRYTKIPTKFTDKKTSGLSVEVGQGKIKKDFALAD